MLLDAFGLDTLEEVLDTLASDGDLCTKQRHTAWHALDRLAVHLDLKGHHARGRELVVLLLGDDIVRSVAVLLVDRHLEGSHAGGSVAVLVRNSVEGSLFYSVAKIYFRQKCFCYFGILEVEP